MHRRDPWRDHRERHPDGAEADAKAIAGTAPARRPPGQASCLADQHPVAEDRLLGGPGKPLIDQTEAASKRRLMTDARVSQVVSDMAEMFDEDPAQLMGEIVRAARRQKQVYRMEACTSSPSGSSRTPTTWPLQVKSGG